MDSRDEILQTFQTITGLDDIGTCFSILEQYSWSLEAAINHIMPQEEVFSSNQSPPMAINAANSDQSNNDGNHTIHNKPLPPSAGMIELNVMYRTMKHSIPLPLTSTLKELKVKLKELTSIECDNQRISGLPVEVTDETQFYDRKYDKLKSTSLLLLEPIVDPVPDLVREPGSVSEPDPVISLLNESDRDKTSAVSQLMGDKDYSYNRMVSHQSLYSEQDDEGSGEGESQCDDVNEGFDDDMFCDANADNYETKTPLIPEGCEDPAEALQFFSSCFTARYGELHPLFYIGSLADALKEATGVPANHRKPMFIYLHHDQSILSNIFCSQLLCIDSIVDYLSNHYVVWAWDLTKEALKRKLLDMVRESFGTSIATHVDDIKPDHLPVILIVYKSKGQIDVRDIIQGLTDPDKLLTTLISAHEQHQLLASDDRKDEREREAREEMIKAQEMAFQDSLQADKEKERLRQQEEEYRLQKELEEQIEKDRKEDERQRMLSTIPAEPEPSCTEKVSSIRMRFPDGSVDQRRFLASSHTLQMLLNYVGSKGYTPSDYKILTTYPKRNITELDLNQTLLEAKLYPTETLHIEDDS